MLVVHHNKQYKNRAIPRDPVVPQPKWSSEIPDQCVVLKLFYTSVESLLILSLIGCHLTFDLDIDDTGVEVIEPTIQFQNRTNFNIAVAKDNALIGFFGFPTQHEQHIDV